MRRTFGIIVALSLLTIPVFAGTKWSIEYSRDLPKKQSGNLSIALAGNRVFSHAFQEPAKTFFPRGVPSRARVDLVITVTESEGAVWGSNPAGEAVPDVAATIGIILQRNWTSASGRWYSTARVPITPGLHLISVPVKSSAWTNVYGKRGNSSASYRKLWLATWRSNCRIGVCAGGHFYGHGVEMVAGVSAIKVTTLRVRK